MGDSSLCCLQQTQTATIIWKIKTKRIRHNMQILAIANAKLISDK